MIENLTWYSQSEKKWVNHVKQVNPLRTSPWQYMPLRAGRMIKINFSHIVLFVQSFTCMFWISYTPSWVSFEILVEPNGHSLKMCAYHLLTFQINHEHNNHQLNQENNFYMRKFIFHINQAKFNFVIFCPTYKVTQT